MPAIDDPLSLEDLPGPAPETPPTYPVPLSGNPPARPVQPLDDLLDLNISDDPAEPKGPLSKW